MKTSIPAGGVIGAGYWGKNLVRNFHHLDDLATICDSDPDRLSRYEEPYPQVPKRLAHSDVLRDSSIQAVAIATRAETHYSLVKDALLAGKDVLVEKPLCLRQEEAAEVVALASERGQVLMVGHLLRCHPAFVKLQELVQTGELGRVYYIYSNRLNLGRIRREENILWSFAPHDVSAILALAGEMPQTVVSRGGNYLHEHITDVSVSVLEFATGLRAHIFVSWLHPYKEQRLVVVGDRRMAVFNDVSPAGQKLLLYPHQIEWQSHVRNPHRAEAVPVAVGETEPLRLECQHFLDCVSTRSRPVTDGKEVRRVLQVLNACQWSLDQGKVISLAVVHSVTVAEERSRVLEELGLEPGGYLLATVHRPNNADDGDNLGSIMRAFDALDETVEAGWNTLVGADAERIVAAVKGFQPSDEPSDLFGDGRASQLIVAHLDGWEGTRQ